MNEEIYLNNKFVGTIEDGQVFVEDLKDLRRKGQLSEQTNIFHDTKNNEVHVNSSVGRAQRPLIVVKEGNPLLNEKHLKQLEDGELSWSDLIRQGVIEYLDAGEEENSLVAFSEDKLTPDHTHMEISPMVICG